MEDDGMQADGDDDWTAGEGQELFEKIHSPAVSIASPDASPMSAGSGIASPDEEGGSQDSALPSHPDSSPMVIHEIASPDPSPGSPPGIPMSPVGWEDGSPPGSPMTEDHSELAIDEQNGEPASPMSGGGSLLGSPVSGGSVAPSDRESPPGSPVSGGSPVAGSLPGSPISAGSVQDSPPGSPVTNGSLRDSLPGSPVSGESAAGSQIGSPPGSPISEGSIPRSAPASPRSSIQSPDGSPPGSPVSNVGSAPASPSSVAGSASPDRLSTRESRPGSRASSRGSGIASPSPTGSRVGSVVSGSGRGSRAGSRSPSGSRAGSRSPSGSRAGSRSPSGSRAGSPAPTSPRSPSGSRAGSRASSRGSAAGSRADSRSRSGSRAGSPVSVRSGAASGPSSPASNKGEHNSGDESHQALEKDIFGESDGEAGSDDEAIPRKRKRIAVASDSEEEAEPKQQRTEEEEEAPEEAEPEQAPAQDILPDLSDDDDEGVNDVRKSDRADFVSDFEMMLQRKRQQSYRRRKRKDIDIINDSDDLIADLLAQMKQAAEEDRELNRQRKIAGKKLKLLNTVVSHIRKQDLRSAFLDQGVLGVLTDWLAPLPDKSLPHLMIRDSMMKILLDQFLHVEPHMLKSSGIGKAVMYLYKHPKETKENRIRAGKLINEWARPIFSVSADFRTLTREEREQRDFEQVPQRRAANTEEAPAIRDLDDAISGDQRGIKPGDKGFVMRARVPLPSTKDYVIRPKWNKEGEISKNAGKKQPTRIDKHIRSMQEKRRQNRAQHAVQISIEGRKMAI